MKSTSHNGVSNHCVNQKKIGYWGYRKMLCYISKDFSVDIPTFHICCC